MLYALVVCAVLCVVCCNAAKLPSYIKPCSRNDPALNECAKRASKDILAHVIRSGDRKHNVPVLDPMLISEMTINPAGLSIHHTNFTVVGLQDLVVRDIRIDLKKRHQEFDLFLPLLTITANYQVSGRLLVLPIRGNGLITVVLKGDKRTLSQDFDLKKKNGKTYIEIKNTNFINSQPTDMKISMTNLFNGDRLLGDNMNVFMNENWRDMHQEIGPYYDQAIAAVVDQLFSGLTNAYSYDEIYPEKV